MTRWKHDQVSEAEIQGVRDELARRQAQRAQHRVWLRWRRRRLILNLLVIERDLADAANESARQHLHHQAERITERLAKNARRLFR
jgi:hypothetical protein